MATPSASSPSIPAASSSRTRSARVAPAREPRSAGALFLLGPAVLGVGVLGGTVAGSLHHKNLGLSDADKARLTVDLNSGKAAVGVLAHYDSAPAISDRLTQLGGSSESHELSDEALQAAAAT